jgi:hypothetical protein
VIELVKLEARLVRLNELIRFLERNPLVPGGQREYEAAIREYQAVDARIERLRRELA